jgi:succinate dehydrogenase / fumarate reductase cytochrome b subunit
MQERYAYYPGCLASLSQKELDSSTRAIAQLLDIELVEMPSATCCGAGDIHEAKPDYYLHISARILGQAERSGCDTILTICNVCTLNLRQANKALQEDPALLNRVNDNLKEVGAATYQGGVDIRHLLWEVSEGEGYARFQQIAKKNLAGLKVAPFYGCQILRPAKILGFEADPDRPQSLERLITAVGAEPIDYPAKIKCCGFPIVLAREDVALGELVQPLQQATEAGADVIVTPCPLCHLSLDAWQRKAADHAGQEFGIPILHLAQLLGAAAGIEESELKFKRHVTRLSPEVKAKLQLPSVVGTGA